METNFQKVEKIILASELEAGEKDDFIVQLALVSDGELASLHELLSEKPELVGVLYRNFKEKQVILKQKNRAGWDILLSKEENLINSESQG